MTAIENPDWKDMRAASPLRIPAGAEEAARSVSDRTVRVVSDEGLELVFRGLEADRTIDPEHSVQVASFAQDFARLCSDRQSFPLPASLIAIARKTQHRITARKALDAKFRKRRRKFADLAAAIACVLLASAVLAGAQRRFGEQRHIAIIALDSIILEAPKTGTLVFATPPGPVSKGEAAAGIRTADGDEFVVEAPCDCQLAFVSVRTGGKVSKDKPLLTFWQKGTREFVSLRIQMADALHLKSGAYVELSAISSGMRRQFKVGGDSVTIQTLPFSAGNKPTGEVAVRIYPPASLDMAAGEVVTARMRTSIFGGEPSAAQAAEGH